jgi:hypothetical protein
VGERSNCFNLRSRQFRGHGQMLACPCECCE